MSMMTMTTVNSIMMMVAMSIIMFIMRWQCFFNSKESKNDGCDHDKYKNIDDEKLRDGILCITAKEYY
jgi:hypothetical protein